MTTSPTIATVDAQRVARVWFDNDEGLYGLITGLVEDAENGTTVMDLADELETHVVDFINDANLHPFLLELLQMTLDEISWMELIEDAAAYRFEIDSTTGALIKA